MLSEQETLRQLETIIDLSPIKETEVLYNHWTEATTRFFDNRVHQNVTETDSEITIKTLDQGRIGSVTTNQCDRKSVELSINQAVDSMNNQPEGSFNIVLLKPQLYHKINNFDPQTAFLSAADRATVIESIITKVAPKNFTAAGALVTGYRDLAILNSKGLKTFHRLSHFGLTLTIVDKNGNSSWTIHEGTSHETEHLDNKISRCIQRTTLNDKPRSIKPGRYTVILEPPATGTFLEFLGWLTFGAKGYLSGRSYFCDRLNKKITGDNITIVDDAFHPMTIGLPFDYEGTPKKKVFLIDRGVASGLVHDTYTAQQMKVETTGHSLPQPNEVGPLPLNIVMVNGSSSLDDIIEQTKNGILVTRFHYNRHVDQKNTVITGLTRDGTFAIRDGQLAYPIKNLRYNTSIINAFNNAVTISKEHYLVGEYGKVVAPAVKLNDFLFTDIAS